MPGTASALLGSLLHLLFPLRCAGCGRRGMNACPACRAAIPWLGTEICPLCASPSRLGRICRACGEGQRALDGARAACRFDGLVRTSIHDLKYRGVRGRAELLGEIAAEAIARRPLAIDVLVPVPLSAARRRERGFNQAELIAAEIGRLIGVPVAGASLERVKETPPQVRRSRDERRENVLGAFACRDASQIAGRRIALVDDVMTTGSTLSSAAEALKAAGAARVFGVVVARET